MDTNIYSSETKAKIVSELKRAVRNINRNLHEWKGRSAGRTNFSISHTEVNGLVRNWLIRCLRETIGYAVADRVFRKGRLSISMDDKNMCVASIYVGFPHCNYDKEIQMFQNILSEIEFKHLHYDPSDYLPDGVTQNPSSVFDPRINISFDKLANFKF